MESDTANPLLIRIVRGPIVESAHRGAVAVVDARGTAKLALGDVERKVYPRSAIKLIQTLPLVESGAADAFGLTAEELAVACASHSGAAYHVAAARSILAKAGLTEQHLNCGAHMPRDAAEAARAQREGARPLHNNCSGKHAGMLAACVHLGLPVQDYERAEHPLQIMIRKRLAALAGEDLRHAPCGIDGCSVPTWGMSLQGLARAFAKLGTGADMDEAEQLAALRLMEACFAAPEWVAGEGRLDTMVLRGLRGEAFVKTGAEGVYAGVLPKLGLGVALKIDDGAKRAAEAALVHLLAALLPHRRDDIAQLGDPEFRNWRGIATGHIGAAPALAAALEDVAHA